MRSTAAVCTLGAWVFLAGAATAAERLRLIWHNDYASASAEAQTLDRPILLYFTGKWCPSCLRVERTAFVDRRVVEFISAHLIAVHIDIDASPELAEKWNVDHLPTALILRKDGQPQGKIEGYRPAENYLSELESLVYSAERRESINEATSDARPAINTIARRTPSKGPRDERIELTARNEKATPNDDSEIRLSLQELNLALDGACVVTIVQSHKVVSGDPQFALEFDGATYWFTGVAQLEKFRADPTHYAPVLSGQCVVSLVDDGCAVPGLLRFAAVYRDRLYLLAGPEQRRRFQANPKRYVDADVTASPK